MVVFDSARPLIDAPAASVMAPPEMMLPANAVFVSMLVAP